MSQGAVILSSSQLRCAANRVGRHPGADVTGGTMDDQSLRAALASIAIYATHQAEHHEHDGLGEARAWRYIAFTAESALGGAQPTTPIEAGELVATLHTVRRRLGAHGDPNEVIAFIDEQLNSRLGSE